MTTNRLTREMTAADADTRAQYELRAIVEPLLAETVAKLNAHWPQTEFTATFAPRPLPGRIVVSWSRGPHVRAAGRFAMLHTPFAQAERYVGSTPFRRNLTTVDEAQLVGAYVASGRTAELVTSGLNWLTLDFPDIDPEWAATADVIAALFMSARSTTPDTETLLTELETFAHLKM